MAEPDLERLPVPVPVPGAGAYRDGKPLVDLIPPDRRRRNAFLLVSASLVAGAALFALAQQVFATFQLRDRTSDEPLTATPMPPPPLSGLTVGLPRQWADRTSRMTGAVHGDGEIDPQLEVIVDGAVVGLALVSTDASGRSFGAQQWDTMVGDRPLPRELDPARSAGSSRLQLGVFRDGASMQDERGALLPLGAGKHLLQLHASDTGWFRAGRHFAVFGVLADGSVVQSNVVTYPPGQDVMPPGPSSGDAPATPPGVFDRAATAAAIGRVDLSTCQMKVLAGAPARAQPTGHLKITFAPDGTVSSASVDDGPLVGTTMGGCVAGKYRQLTVPRFAGPPVTVGKSFVVQRDDGSGKAADRP